MHIHVSLMELFCSWKFVLETAAEQCSPNKTPTPSTGRKRKAEDVQAVAAKQPRVSDANPSGRAHEQNRRLRKQIEV